MIGNIIISKSFGDCIAYCLDDKKQQQGQEVTFKNRAEILFGNFCSGTKQELIEQFNDVRCTNPRLRKPVMHAILSLAQEDKLDRGTMIQMVQDLAKAMHFERHQYLAVSHIDTRHPHVHVVVNRIGLDGKTLDIGHNYRKFSVFCREMEVKYGLRQVLSPRRFLSKEQRLIPRHNIRNENLRIQICKILESCKTFETFREKMEELNYKVIKGMGICFIDVQGVKIKGSDVGFPLHAIETRLKQNEGLQLPGTIQRERHPVKNQETATTLNSGRERGENASQTPDKGGHPKIPMEALLHTEKNPDGVNRELLTELQRKKRKRRHLRL